MECDASFLTIIWLDDFTGIKSHSMKFASVSGTLTAALSLWLGRVTCEGHPQRHWDPYQQKIPIMSGNSTHRPNIVLVLTDDLDQQLRSMDYMPLVKKHLVERGTFYRRHYCTTALCCPSRVSLLTGKAAHNTNVTDVKAPWGGYPKFVRQGLNDNYLPIWLQNLGYSTYYTGKLFNAHTVDNYHRPFAAGWNGSDFLLDPYTYAYRNSTYQRNQEAPVSYEGAYTGDVLEAKAYDLLDMAVTAGQPFFLGLAPIAPHGDVHFHALQQFDGTPNISVSWFTPPVAAERHQGLFTDARIPRGRNFNPGNPSGASWIRNLPQQGDDNVKYNDHFYRQRLRSLQSVDELVEGIISRLEEYGILEDTFLLFTSDNGYHISQHRMQPGKECGYEEDINVPLVIRGPGVPWNMTTDIATTHTDLAPTILDIAGADSCSADFDGAPIPLTRPEIIAASHVRHEHVNVEYWGYAVAEGKLFPGHSLFFGNNTYKSLRLVGEQWDLYYSVWCNGEHELYDMQTDQGQMVNILAHHDYRQSAAILHGHPLEKVVTRLDTLLLVLKSCKGHTCVEPWRALHPAGDVRSLDAALSPRLDSFYDAQPRVMFDRCEMGLVLDAEGPEFRDDGFVYRNEARWSDWT
ncbi:alkaline-phosphatase-like protein [Xylariomycetidae sp. FL0641]|nr:alkaline-phosphatase-like protein [Xylariomycetidae sp. FL0641]